MFGIAKRKIAAVGARFLKASARRYDLFLLVKPILGLSDAQYYLLRRAESALGRPPTFLQLGANDGMWFDPIRPFARWRKWRGVLVEPQPGVYNILRENYRGLENQLRFANVAAAATSDEHEFQLYSVSEQYLQRLSRERQLHLLRKASFQRENVARYLPAADQHHIVAVRVPALSVIQIWDRYGSGNSPDVLVMDLEGFDGQMLLSIDFSTFRPSLIIFEAVNLPEEQLSEVIRKLKAAGYTTQSLAHDMAAVRNDLASILAPRYTE